jgi:hypothetical protein
MFMMTIKLDAAYCYQRAATIAVQRSLMASHGPEFAQWFTTEHSGSIARAARTGLCGRTEAAVFSLASRLRARAGGA